MEAWQYRILDTAMTSKYVTKLSLILTHTYGLHSPLLRRSPAHKNTKFSSYIPNIDRDVLGGVVCFLANCHQVW